VLRVLTAPVLGVPITGLKPGISDYAVDCSEDEMVYLTAPQNVEVKGRTFQFVCWFVDNEPKLRGQRDILVTMGADHVALAQYEWGLPGDANNDCAVNVLDLIHVRNRIGDHCPSE